MIVKKKGNLLDDPDHFIQVPSLMKKCIIEFRTVS